jgi:hypothetical protein
VWRDPLCTHALALLPTCLSFGYVQVGTVAEKKHDRSAKKMILLLPKTTEMYPETLVSVFS